MITAGLCSVTFRALEPEAVIDLAASSGLAAIEWGGDIHAPPGDLATAGRIAERCAASGIIVASYGSYLRAGRSTADDIAAALDAAVALGAPNVRVWAPRQVAWDDAVAGLSAVCEEAEARALTVATEHHVGTWTETVEGSTALRAEVGAPNLFTYWQPLPGRSADDHVAEVIDLAPSLSHLHVFQWRDDGTRLSLVDGEATWPAVIAAVGKCAGRWSAPRMALLEFVIDDAPAALVADAAVLLRWLVAA